MTDTIVALSSGRPPAAIAVVRVSGPRAFAATAALAGTLPSPRQARVRALRDGTGLLLDRALVLVFPGPASATGEDLVELHCHGGRAVVAAVEGALLAQDRVRAAAPGEFTRRAVLNGRIDLAQAQGLADLLEAETEAQRRAALAVAEGQVSRALRGWLDRLTAIAAAVEASIDFAEEGEVAAEVDLLARATVDAARLRDDIGAVLVRPAVERLRDGIRVVIGGPPNSGKSTLLNRLCAREAAIVSAQAGTTRDRIDVSVTRDGIAYLLTDTAGLRDAAHEVERLGIKLAEQAMGTADVLVWLGDDLPPRTDALWLHARSDEIGRERLALGPVLAIRQDRAETIETVWRLIAAKAATLLPRPDELLLRREQREACGSAAAQLILPTDPILAAEQLRVATAGLAMLLGGNAPAAVLDALFGRFCLGK